MQKTVPVKEKWKQVLLDKPRSTHLCRVLPPGEFTGMILELFSICSQSFAVIAVTIMLHSNKVMSINTKLQLQATKNSTSPLLSELSS